MVFMNYSFALLNMNKHSLPARVKQQQALETKYKYIYIMRTVFLTVQF